MRYAEEATRATDLKYDGRMFRWHVKVIPEHCLPAVSPSHSSPSLRGIALAHTGAHILTDECYARGDFTSSMPCVHFVPGSDDKIYPVGPTPEADSIAGLGIHGGRLDAICITQPRRATRSTALTSSMPLRLSTVATAYHSSGTGALRQRPCCAGLLAC